MSTLLPCWADQCTSLEIEGQTIVNHILDHQGLDLMIAPARDSQMGTHLHMVQGGNLDRRQATAGHTMVSDMDICFILW